MTDIRAAFQEQAKSCIALGSPFMGQLMTLVGTRLTPEDPVSDNILNWSGNPAGSADNVPLRLAGALHALRLQERALTEVYPPQSVSDDTLWDAVRDAMRTHADWILDWLESPPQTNEVRRAAALLPALALVEARFGKPVELLELGTSGGLNLRADLFRVVLPNGAIGPGDAKVVLTPEWRGALPNETRLPKIIRRAGVDLAPLDLANSDDRTRLMAYLWADQPDRLERTQVAIETAQDCPAQLEAGDAGDWLVRTLSYPADGKVRLVFHTLAWQYFPEVTREKAKAAMAAYSGPLLRFSMEADGGESAALTLTTYPSGNVEQLGRADFHGHWIDWQAA